MTKYHWIKWVYLDLGAFSEPRVLARLKGHRHYLLMLVVLRFLQH